MRKLCILVLFITVAGFCFAADPVEGFWISVDDKSGKETAGWQVYEQGGKLYGKILSVTGKPQTVLADKCTGKYTGFPVAGDVSKMQVVGSPWIFGLSMKKSGEWEKGSVIDPEEGKMYGCEITFRAAGSKSGGKTFTSDTLEMRGKIGPFGRSQFWRRATQAEASGLR